MYIDSEDVDHIFQNLIKDIPKLMGKIQMMQLKIDNSLKKISVVDHRIECNKWKNPVTKTCWEIYYVYVKYKTFKQIEFYPITSIERNGIKDYFLFYHKDVEKAKKREGFLVKIFKGHFISRFKKRAGIDATIFDIIHNFQYSEKHTIVDYFKQKEKWLLYLNRYGIAFVKKDLSYLSFDTFIPPSELKSDQKKIILDHFEKLYNTTDYPFLLSLEESEYWKDFIDPKKFNSVKKDFEELLHKAADKQPQFIRDNLLAIARTKDK